MYSDNVLRILNIMKATFDGGPFKMFYYGDPELIPDFNLPALVVTGTQDQTDPGAMGQDDITETIVVKVILNKKDDWQNDINPENTTETKLRALISERDATTGNYLDATVRGALRTLGTQGLTAIGRQVSTEYGIVPRVNDVITAEGHVTFTLEYSVDVDELI